VVRKRKLFELILGFIFKKVMGIVRKNGVVFRNFRQFVIMDWKID